MREDDQIYLFLVTAWIVIDGLPLQHWNRTDNSKLLVKFAHVIEISEKIINKFDLRAVGARGLWKLALHP